MVVNGLTASLDTPVGRLRDTKTGQRTFECVGVGFRVRPLPAVQPPSFRSQVRPVRYAILGCPKTGRLKADCFRKVNRG